MKFDMNRAWSEALALLSANRQVVLIVAGVFFFLPQLIVGLATGQISAEFQASLADASSQTAIGNRLMGFYGTLLPYVIPVLIAQGIGMLALLALLRDARRPTVGEALKTGAIAFLPYIGAMIVAGIIITAAITLLFVIAGLTGSAAVGVIAVIATFVLAVYAYVKISLVPAVLTIDRIYNPLTALLRSWRLTTGNSLRLFLFYFLLILAFVVVAAVVSIVFGLLGAIGGAQGALILGAIANALVSAGLTLVLLAVLAAIHHQLAGPSASAVSETFA